MDQIRPACSVRRWCESSRVTGQVTLRVSLRKGNSTRVGTDPQERPTRHSGPVQVPLGKFHDGCAGQYAGKTKFRETAEWKGKTGVFCGQLRHGKGAAV